jgi:acyl-CoA synthetase (AMP-forming)/AMP-acid ligase II/3-hydroxymyristoyl/3-hydroxydecanoyl-(acyl carrier protein) dehydratase
MEERRRGVSDFAPESAGNGGFIFDPAAACSFDLETGRVRTVGDLARRKAELAAELQEREALAVQLCCEDRFNFLVALVTAAELGLTIQLAPKTQRSQNIGPRSLRIVDSPSRGTPGGLGDPELDVLPMDGDSIRTGAVDPEPHARVTLDLSRLELEFWTSGSSEEPRRFRKSARQLLSEASLIAEFWQLRAGDRLVCTAPPHHIYGLLWGVLAPFLGGASVLSTTPRHGAAIAEAVRKAEPLRLVSVPAQLAALLGTFEIQTPPKLPGHVVSSGAPLHAEVARGLEAHGVFVLEVLGSTETGGIAWRRPTRSTNYVPLPGVSVARSPDGFLVVDSLHLPEAQRPFVTSDLVEMRGEGFEHRGRSDPIVKIGANRVSLGEIEERAKRLPGIVELRAVALAVADSQTHPLEIGVVAIAPGYSPQLLRTLLCVELPSELWPKRARMVDSFPVDERGKVTRASLASLFDRPSPSRVPLAVTVLEAPSTSSPSRAVLRVTVPGDATSVQGHFVQHPIVPGAALLNDAIVEPVASLWLDLARPKGFTHVRCPSPLRPFETARVTLERNKSRVDFRVEKPSEVVLAGTYLFDD